VAATAYGINLDMIHSMASASGRCIKYTICVIWSSPTHMTHRRRESITSCLSDEIPYYPVIIGSFSANSPAAAAAVATAAATCHYWRRRPGTHPWKQETSCDMARDTKLCDRI